MLTWVLLSFRKFVFQGSWRPVFLPPPLLTSHLGMVDLSQDVKTEVLEYYEGHLGHDRDFCAGYSSTRHFTANDGGMVRCTMIM